MRALGTHRRPGRVALVAASLLLAAVLSACNPAQVGAAAIVGNTRISLEQLRGVVHDYAESLPERPEVTGQLDLADVQRAFLQRLVVHEVLVEVARRERIRVTPAQIDARVEEERTARDEEQPPNESGLSGFVIFLANSGFTEETFRLSTFDSIVTERLGGDDSAQEAIREVSADLGVEINPRFGTWDGATIAAGTGSVSRPVQTETPTPTPTPTG